MPPGSISSIPAEEEEAKVERLLAIGIPSREEIAEIEISSRLYKENDAFYMTASVLTGAENGMPEASPVTFILAKGRLVTVRYAEPGVFRIFVNQTQKANSNFRDCDDVFVALLEAVIDRTADILEKASADTDAIRAPCFAQRPTTVRRPRTTRRFCAVSGWAATSPQGSGRAWSVLAAW